MKIKINNRNWKIERVPSTNKNLAGNQEEDEMLCGITCFNKSTIYINEELENDNMKDTICHELAHAFIFVYGHPQYENYSEENVCDMFGAFGLELTNLAIDIFTEWGLN